MSSSGDDGTTTTKDGGGGGGGGGGGDGGVMDGSAEDSVRRLVLDLPDDFHHHVRDGVKTKKVLEHASKRFGRMLIMPNTKPPIVNTEMALQYRQHFLDSLPKNVAPTKTKTTTTTTTMVEPLMTLYLTDNTTPDEIRKAHNTNGQIVACKYYPAGATTNSDHGVSDVTKVYPALETMQEIGMMLLIHSEVTHGDIFERESIFLDEVMTPLVKRFPTLRMVMEHISTKDAVDYVLNAPDNLRATITAHHLLYNRNHLLVGGIRPHLYCLPILKAERHRRALLEAATSGSPKFFAGTDSAPHAIQSKETSCGCAGVFTAHAAVELYAEAFDSVHALDKLNDFCSKYGAEYYCLPLSSSSTTGGGGRKTLTLVKESWRVPPSFDFGDGNRVIPLRAGEEIHWKIVEN